MLVSAYGIGWFWAAVELGILNGPTLASSKVMSLFDLHMQHQRFDIGPDVIKSEANLTFCDTSECSSDSELSDLLAISDTDPDTAE